MKKSLLLLITVLVVVTVAVGAVAQDRVTQPPSSLVRTPGHVRTPLYVIIPANNTNPEITNGENPGSLACLYGLTAPVSGCPKSDLTMPVGGARAIAVVEYGRYANMQNDLNFFSTQYGLPAVTATEICSPGPPPCPANNGSGWDLETALDVQYAHAMAPSAQIIVSEFANDPIGDGAETAAANAVAAAGGGEVSNSWTYNGGENWCGSGNCELSYDSYFVKQGVVFFASAGDDGLGPAYPSISPNVVSAGGTQIMRDSNGNYTTESCWNGSGGGIGIYEPLPQYQLYIGNRTGPKRGTPDWAADASPVSGVNVYSSPYCGGWCVVGGTSVSSPVLAGIVNWAGHFRISTLSELSPTYQWYIQPVTYHVNFFDVTTGNNGAAAGPGWDQCTGLGSPRKASQF